MATFRQASEITANAEAVFAWLGRAGAHERMLPPWESLELTRWDGPPLRDGGRIAVRARMLPGVWHEWEAEYREVTPPGEGREGRFVEEMVSGPLRQWRHEHRLIPVGSGCRLEEEVSWSRGDSDLLWTLGESMLQPRLQRMFRFRHRRIEGDLYRYAQAADPSPRTVAVSGHGGLVGRSLVPFLRGGGHQVRPMVRRPSAQDSGPEREVFWSIDEGTVDLEALEGVDAVVHLAGAPIAGRRWTEAYKAELMRSRVEGTRLVCEHLARMERPPRVLICASASGYYGNRGDEVLTEESSAGDTFLAQVCKGWEEATLPAVEAGIRVVNLRTGILLAAGGGMLQPLLPVFRAGMGGAQGSGRQFVPWIALEDMVGAIYHALVDEGLSGPVNVSAPEPVQQLDLARALGNVLERPAFVPTPALALRVALGRQMADEVALASQRAVPKKLQERGFHWLYPDLEEALRFELGLES